MRLFRREKRILEHPYFGRLRKMRGEYWEGELEVPGLPGKIGLTLPAPEAGPTARQVDFYAAALADLDALFARCRPVFESDFEEWTGKPFPADWREDFSLVGLDVPAEGDEMRDWSVCYFVDAANHYFTAHFEHGRASYLTVDG